MLAAPFWEGQVHDCQTGGITALATSFDDSFLLSAARDGTLYIHVRQATCPRWQLNDLAADDDFNKPLPFPSKSRYQTAWPKPCFQ